MAYTNNVPQGNQTIAATTDPIRNNFGFIQTDLQVEHTFNGNTAAAEGTHLKASMPNQADPVSLPTGCNGMYYVGNGGARFYDGTTVSRLTEGSAGQNGYQWIGKVLVQWGVVASVTQDTVNFNAPNIHFPNAIFSVYTAPFGSNFAILSGAASIATFSPVQSGFTWKWAGSTTGYGGFYWLAIGN